MNAYRNANPIYITEEHLGNPEDGATRAAAERLCELLEARGWDVRYGPGMPRWFRPEDPAWETGWNAALDRLSAELFGAPETPAPDPVGGPTPGTK